MLSPEFPAPPSLHRHFGLLHAPALNVAMIVGPGVVLPTPPLLHPPPRRGAGLGRRTVAVGLGVLAVIGWIIVEGLLHADLATALDFSGAAGHWPDGFAAGLGQAMILAMYSSLGYYNVCYVGDEVREPG